MRRRPWVSRFPVARFLWDFPNQVVVACDGGRHPDRQPQVPGFQRPEALLAFRLFLQSLLGCPPPGGDEQLRYAHAVVEGLTRAHPRVVNPPDRALVTAREGGPQHAPDGQLPPQSSQLLLRGLEQLQP
jgi:hypothetical protein